MIIVGVGYIARSGKDEVAKYLTKEYGFNHVSFARALKDGCMKMFGLTHEQVYGDLKEVIDDYWQLTPRQILQKVGTDLLRNGFNKDIWIKAVQKEIFSGDSNSRWVISDLRFMNEANSIKEWGGTLLRVDREQAGAAGNSSSHESENSLCDFNGWDYILNNDKNGLHFLYREVDNFMKWLKTNKD